MKNISDWFHWHCGDTESNNISWKIFQTGFIDIVVIQDVIGNLGDKMSTEDINYVIDIADEDGDGTINYEEIMKLVRRNEHF